MGLTKKEKEKQRKERLGAERINNQGCKMKCIEYKNSMNIMIEFQDEYKYVINSRWYHFDNGGILNPYYPTVYDIGIVGRKYDTKNNNKKNIKEYKTWVGMLERCYSEKWKIKNPAYKDVTVCKEWLLYENFYEWLHSQENFDKWVNLNRSAIDKDIIVKRNKIYSPETCCLVPQNVNSLFTRADIIRGKYPIGVHWHNASQKFCAKVRNPFIDEEEIIGEYDSPIKAFNAYKKYKEKIIKQVAKEEYNKGNITEKCYEAMMNYVVEITD